MKWIRRRKIRRQTKCHFGQEDFFVAGYRFHAVHFIPENIKENQELDFYCDTSYDVYLLRLKSCEDKSVVVCPHNFNSCIYIQTKKLEFHYRRY